MRRPLTSAPACLVTSTNGNSQLAAARASAPLSSAIMHCNEKSLYSATLSSNLAESYKSG